MMNKIILIGITILLFACNSNKPKEEIQSPFYLTDKMYRTTKTVRAEYTQLKNELSLFGKIVADNNKMVEIFPVVGGNVNKVYVELGDYVKKGQLLASIRSTEVASFDKEFEDAKNDVIVAKNKLKVAKELFEGNLSTESSLIEAKSELEKAQSQLNRIKETYKIYHIKDGATFEVRSPLSGFIIQKKINQDMILRNDRSDNIFDIAEIKDVWALANVNETDIDQVKMGINASVSTLSYPDKKFYGHVDKIFNIIDPETKAMKVRIKLQNPEYLLKPEMRATIKLSYKEDKQMITIPAKSLIFDKSKNFVLIFKNRKNIETRQVEVFRTVGDDAFIQSGILKGDRVITENQLLIYDELND